MAPAELIERLAPRSERGVIAALLGFALMLRAALLFIGYAQTEIARTDPANQGWVTPTSEGAHETIDRLTFADPGWYLGIAEHGYARRPFSTARAENWGFFPGWPLAIRAAMPVLGGPRRAAIALANLASLGAIVLLYLLLRLDYGPGISAATTALFCASPFAYHLMRPGAEPLFCLASFASFLAARRRQYLIAGLAGAGAVLTRLPGLFLFPALGLMAITEAWSRRGSTSLRASALRALPLLLIPAALLGFMLYLRALTGNLMAYFDIQQAIWTQSSGFPFASLVAWVMHPTITAVFGWDLTLLSGVMGIAVLAVVIAGVVLQVRGALHLRAEYWLYLGLTVLMIFSRGYFAGVGRYTLPTFQLFLLATLLLARRPFGLLGAGAACIAVQSFLFTNFLAYRTWAG